MAFGAAWRADVTAAGRDRWRVGRHCPRQGFHRFGFRESPEIEKPQAANQKDKGRDERNKVQESSTKMKHG
jgi:hypothetical protein